MRHKYHTTALVLARSPSGESNVLITLLTQDLGLVRARAQGLRKPGAKLASSLATLSETEVTLVRGAEGWRLVGAVLVRNWFSEIVRSAHVRAARVSGLFLRLVPGEVAEPSLFVAMQEFFETLVRDSESTHDAAECRVALGLLRALGLDAGEIPALALIEEDRSTFVARINRGIAASGL